MNRIANLAARGLSEFDLVAEQKPPTIYGLHPFAPAEQNAILGPLYPHAPDTARIAIDQIWMIKDPARRAPFMALLAGFASTQAAGPHLDLPALRHSTAALLPVAHAGAPSRAEMMLALWGVTGGRADPAARAFLLANAGTARRLTMPGSDTVEGLTGGSASERDILQTLGLLGAPAPSSGGGPAPNMDLDGDGVAETYVQSITRRGMVAADWLNVRERPDIGARCIEVIRAGTTLDVFGMSGQWFAVERPGRIGFVHRRFLRQLAVA
jgi:hypothetical protein